MLVATISTWSVRATILQILGSLGVFLYGMKVPSKTMVDPLRKRNNKAAALRMQQGAAVQTEMIFIDMNNHFEAVANHALNVIQAGRRD